jgi:hypothetical protein
VREGEGEFTAYALTVNPVGSQLRQHTLNQWSLINPAQGRCIARFLRLMIAIQGTRQGEAYPRAFCEALASQWREALASHWHAYG